MHRDPPMSSWVFEFPLCLLEGVLAGCVPAPLSPCALIHMLSKVPQRCACQHAEAAASLRGNCGRRMLRGLSRDVSMACSSGIQGYEMLCGPEKRSNMTKGVPITKLKCISMLLKKKIPATPVCVLKVKMANRPLRRHYTDSHREWGTTWRKRSGGSPVFTAFYQKQLGKGKA